MADWQLMITVLVPCCQAQLAEEIHSLGRTITSLSNNQLSKKKITLKQFTKGRFYTYLKLKI
ncbi:unnamed protein product [Lupinus luteus]|uniref:Uncharacterized protein n=1 Tax=Lupinus luteus TaxID=3873 RepID=A0AAV1WK61_LUPLU